MSLVSKHTATPALARSKGFFTHRPTDELLSKQVEERARPCLLNGAGAADGCLTSTCTRIPPQAAIAPDGELPTGATLLQDACSAAHVGSVLIPPLTAFVESREQGQAPRMLPALVRRGSSESRMPSILFDRWESAVDNLGSKFDQLLRSFELARQAKSGSRP